MLVCDQCQFPFTFNNKTFHKCTWEGASHPWCVTNSFAYNDKLNLYSHFINASTLITSSINQGWKNCSNDCPVKNKICSECKFPFEYGGDTYRACTHDY